jgi:hypothetical protein
MPLTADGSSSLIAGGMASTAMKTNPPETKHVQVDRAFYYDGKAQKIGTVLELKSRFATEMVTANKAHFVEPSLAQPAEQSSGKQGGRKEPQS